MSYCTLPEVNEQIAREFENFVSNGVPGETCRMYMSVNARNEEKSKNALLLELVLHLQDKIKLTRMEAVTASVCARKENAAERRWLFDFDINDAGSLEEFVADIENLCPDVKIHTYKTLHGYAVIIDHGFDTRKLFEKWTENVALKRDDMLLVCWATKETSENGNINLEGIKADSEKKAV